ncbi:metallophosphatase domain-containing protein [Sandaracinus amylolyticus]|uniref:metallophosphatase domain-containing protein n=1 Tax=Sandaracinus amylolyticus TaxID=927083 RepID=UPI001F1997D1|nr:metallophosphatase domain-containing protein [Sandaracinus amylolyticus]UJR79937.1 Metallophosphoesterase domain-containing protein 1 [Sandaracinus amylolyticus]
MRVVAVADTHTFEHELWVPDGDVLVHAGDMLRGGTLEELEGVARWIRALPHRHKVIVAGNHDVCFEHMSSRSRALAMIGADDPSSGVVYLEDSGVEIEALRIWGSPWQPAYHDWAFNLPRGSSELAAKWALVPSGIDVLITHGTPCGIGDRGPTSGRHGCERLREAMPRIRPRVHLFGHIHQDGGAWTIDGTLHANVTTWECERGATVIDVDATSARTFIVPPRG